MSKRFIIGALVIMVAGIGLTLFLASRDRSDSLIISKNELSEQLAARLAATLPTNVPTQAVLVPLDLSHPVRLAIGGLGLADNDQNQRLGDLVTVALTGTPGFNLVERQSLNAILQELNLNLSGFVRAKDAVRVGKLLKTDWFLLATEAKLNDTNSLVIRVVDAHTGVMRDAGVVPVSQSPEKLAADVAAFVRQSRQNAASAKTRVYLAISAFADLTSTAAGGFAYPTAWLSDGCLPGWQCDFTGARICGNIATGSGFGSRRADRGKRHESAPAPAIGLLVGYRPVSILRDD